MKYAALFAVFAAGLTGWAAVHGGRWYLVFWPAATFSFLALAYATTGASLLGKQSNGAIRWWAVILYLPYFLLLWGLWHLLRLTQREDCCNEIAPGLWLGRRPLAHEMPQDVDLIVDLTAEFCESKNVIGQRAYLCLPILDTSVPDLTLFDAAVERTAKWPGHVYIHCASGHGRSAAFMAAVLIRKGITGTLDQAIEQIKRARPGIGLQKRQYRFLECWLHHQKENAAKVEP